jgi:hypothetical protein
MASLLQLPDLLVQGDDECKGSLQHSRPWSKADYFARVETFTLATWSNKPLQLSPLQCARFGWSNAGKDTLQCLACNSYLVFSISPQLGQQSGE